MRNAANDECDLLVLAALPCGLNGRPPRPRLGDRRLAERRRRLRQQLLHLRRPARTASLIDISKRQNQERQVTGSPTTEAKSE